MGYSKRIERLGPTANGHVFEFENRKTTIYDYFLEKKIKLKYPDLPCVCLGKENYTPMELCKTELLNMKKLNPKQTSDMIRATAVPCNQRRNDIENIMAKCGIKEDPILKQFNIKTKLKMIELDGRVLNAPDLEYKGTRITSAEIGNKGQWDNTRRQFLVPCKLEDWIVINFGRRVKGQTVDEFLNALIKVGRSHGLQIKNQSNLVDGNCNMEPKAVRELLDSYVKKQRVQLIFAILENSTNIYSERKYFFINKSLSKSKYFICFSAFKRGT
jgi:eukaryotic translation initiation factor 2C